MFDFALPDGQHLPTHTFESEDTRDIPRLVAFELGIPVARI